MKRPRPVSHRNKLIITGVALSAFASAAYFILPSTISLNYDANRALAEEPTKQQEAQVPQQENKKPEFVVTHVKTPDPVRAIYMSSWVAGTTDWRNSLVDLIDKTELNSIVIDIKDYSGAVAFHVDNPLVNAVGSTENRIPDIKQFIDTLHKKGIYVIGRITVFQDPIYSKSHPGSAVQKESDKSVWKDYKGLSYVDPSAHDFWNYILAIAEESYAVGFDELNFDYIRFPSDGNMKDIYYPLSEQTVDADPDFGKAKVIRDFFSYLHSKLTPMHVVMSADLFGITTTNSDDLNIGQVLEYAEPYFDYIAPMVYPSHYPKGFNGYDNPNHYPYEVVHYSMSRAAERLDSASSTRAKLRPWLQDFDYGGNYGKDEVRAQIQAVYDSGLDSWMLWDAGNKYTESALEPK